MSTRTLLCLLAGLSIGWSASAQTPVPKPKPARRPATATKPVDKTAAVVPPAPAPPPTDLKIRTRLTSGPQVSENTTYFKGARQRFEFPGITMITQCDLKRSVQLQDATKHFMLVPTDTPAPAVSIAGSGGATTAAGAAGTTAGSAAPKSGVISETITLTDTGGHVIATSATTCAASRPRSCGSQAKTPAIRKRPRSKPMAGIPTSRRTRAARLPRRCHRLLPPAHRVVRIASRPGTPAKRSWDSL